MKKDTKKKRKKSKRK